MTTAPRIRSMERYTVGVIIPGKDGWSVVHTKEGTGFSRPDEDLRGLEADSEFELETTGGSFITGLRFNSEWLFRKTDEDLAAEHQKMVEGFAEQRRKALEENRESWQARQDALPEWARVRIENFHKTGGENFAVEGWAYELACCELAVLYAESDLEDSEAITEYAKVQGTTGNQHGFAKILARTHLERNGELVGVATSDLPSAMTPLTGDPDYSGKK